MLRSLRRRARSAREPHAFGALRGSLAALAVPCSGLSGMAFKKRANDGGPRMIRPRPCRFCRKWFRPHPRVGERQRACSAAECRKKSRASTQAKWRSGNSSYFVARRIVARGASERAPEPLRVRRPLDRLPWDLAQDEFGVQGADLLGVFGRLLTGYAQDEIRAQAVDYS